MSQAWYLVSRPQRLLPATLGPKQFLGEISFLSGGNWSFQLRAARNTRVTELPRVRMLELMAHVPEMSDIIEPHRELYGLPHRHIRR